MSARASGGASGPGAGHDVLAETEAWFRRNGLPYFVPETRAEARAALRPRTLWPVVVAVLFAALVLGGVLTWQTESASFAPATLTFLGVLAAGTYAVTRMGARPIVTFAVHRTVSGLRGLLPMAMRALPLLLVFMTFLFINAEVWMLSAYLDGALLWLTVLLFSAVAVVFLMVRLPEDVDTVDDRIDAPMLVTASRGTPLAGVALELVRDHGDELDLQSDAEVSGYERGNLIVVLAVIQAAQVLLLSLAVFGFFLVFGLLTMKRTVQEAWIGARPHSFDWAGNASAELLQVSVFLAAFSFLYFTVYVVTDENYRAQFYTGVLRELEKAVAVRTVYRHLRRRRDAEAATRTLPATEPGND